MTTGTDHARLSECSATLKDGTLHLSTGAASFTFQWNEGHLVGLDASAGTIRWPLAAKAPDSEFPGHMAAATGGAFHAQERPATAALPACLLATVDTHLGSLEVRKVFRLYPDCPAIGVDLYLRGRVDHPWQRAAAEAGDLDNIEGATAAAQGRVATTILHRLMVPHHHLDIEAVSFYDISDRRNNFVATRRVQPYRQPLPLAGNLLLCRDRLADRSLFLLKEAPPSDVQLAWPGCDFIVRNNELQVVGLGLTPADVAPSEWVRGYGFALGVAPGDEFALLRALRDYQHRLRVRTPGRDHMIMLNTWGDRGQGERVNEAGALAEIAAGKRLGITHLQLDHGWETTREASAVWPLDLKRIWDHPQFWQVNPVRFPRGLKPCIEAGRAAGVELCLWFNPSMDDDCGHWKDDADVLIRLHREHGIRIFKIDGVALLTKRAEINFRRLLDTVVAASNGEVAFNLDITAGRRFGCNYFTEYGTFFIENRYTDWSNYYPHWALRNLWQLSRYVPAQALQVEFLNVWRNQDKYPPDDPLAPRNVPFEYAFAVTMMAQPLAWFESAHLPEEAFRAAGLIALYRRHVLDIHAGCILPIGEEPNGTNWTGFQSTGQAHRGHVLFFREWNSRPEASLPAWDAAGSRLRATRIAGSGPERLETTANGRWVVTLPTPFSFGWYQYES